MHIAVWQDTHMLLGKLSINTVSWASIAVSLIRRRSAGGI